MKIRGGRCMESAVGGRPMRLQVLSAGAPSRLLHFGLRSLPRSRTFVPGSPHLSTSRAESEEGRQRPGSKFTSLNYHSINSLSSGKLKGAHHGICSSIASSTNRDPRSDLRMSASGALGQFVGPLPLVQTLPLHRQPSPLPRHSPLHCHARCLRPSDPGLQ